MRNRGVLVPGGRAFFLLASAVCLAACGARLTSGETSERCATIDSSLSADASALDDTRIDEVANDAGSDDDAGMSEATRCANAVLPPVQTPCAELCIVVVRLDYESKAVLGYRSFCDPGRLFDWGSGDGVILRLQDARLVAQGALQLDAPPETKILGFDFTFFHAPTGESAAVDGGVRANAGAFAIVEPTLGRLVVAGTIDTSLKGGEIMYPDLSSWLSPPDPSVKCPTPFDGKASALNPPGAPAFSNELALEVAAAAWDNAIGRAFSRFNQLGDAHAGVFRYAPTWKGTFRDWIVVFHPGIPCCSTEC